MSTQNPDNLEAPSYAVDGVLKGDGEVQEVAEVFSLGADEQMWDSEGNDVDCMVVRKLLSGGDWNRSASFLLDSSPGSRGIMDSAGHYKVRSNNHHPLCRMRPYSDTEIRQAESRGRAPQSHSRYKDR
ncbi:MAG: phosphoenolpyruvate carboxylase [Chloroflexota bacterium]